MVSGTSFPLLEVNPHVRFNILLFGQYTVGQGATTGQLMSQLIQLTWKPCDQVQQRQPLKLREWV